MTVLRKVAWFLAALLGGVLAWAGLRLGRRTPAIVDGAVLRLRAAERRIAGEEESRRAAELRGDARRAATWDEAFDLERRAAEAEERARGAQEARDRALGELRRVEDRAARARIYNERRRP